MNKDIRLRVKEVVANFQCVAVDQIHSEDSLEGLGLDSLATTALLVELEEEFSVKCTMNMTSETSIADIQEFFVRYAHGG